MYILFTLVIVFACTRLCFRDIRWNTFPYSITHVHNLGNVPWSKCPKYYLL